MATRFFSTKEVAAQIGVSRQTLYTWIESDLIDAPAASRPGARLWTKADIAKAAKAKGKLRRGPKRKKLAER
jgi:excisionase family DNA binding protein